MELKIVSLKLAKKLKEIGFNAKCALMWEHSPFINDDGNEDGLCDPELLLCSDTKYTGDCYWNDFSNSESFETDRAKHLYSAPSLELAKMWFREERNVSIEPIRINSKTSKYWFDIKMVIRGVSHSLHSISFNHYDFNTYEEALEAGLFEACKLIINK